MYNLMGPGELGHNILSGQADLGRIFQTLAHSTEFSDINFLFKRYDISQPICIFFLFR